VRRIYLTMGPANEPKLSDYERFDKSAFPDLADWDYDRLPVERADAAELVADHVLDRLGYVEAGRALTHWVTLLSRGGELTITATDFDTVARSYLRAELDINQVNGILGPSHHSLVQLVDVLKNAGLLVTKARIEGTSAVVVAERP
jgi:predicted SAM-dependent methyltransferase